MNEAATKQRRPQKTKKFIRCRERLIDLSVPKVMGILNTTPDSFYDGGAYSTDKKILEQVETMLQQGATFIDVGGYSSRPGANIVSEDLEIKRVEPVVKLLIKEFPELLISIDTCRHRIAAACLEAGAVMINDISAGLLDPKMLTTVAKAQVPYVMMHMRGTVQTMNSQTKYDNLFQELLHYFSQRMAKARQLGIHDLVIDPGFGFSKKINHNFMLLRELSLFQALEAPILVGISRKSMIYKTLGVSAEKALNGTTALHMAALERGASLLRVHDVYAAQECVQLYVALQGD